jgi:hypothetical protein
MWLKRVNARKAQSFTKPVRDDKPYDMPEDRETFNDYWIQAEQSLNRPLQYEEVIVLYNRYRHAFETLSDHEG